MSKTIAAIATPAAPAGLGVIRISGREALTVAGRIFRPAAKNKELESIPGYTALYGHVYDEEGDIDDCVALVFRAPHSYTGENVVELSCHGGLYLLRRVLRAVIAAGAAPAAAGEFTRRAFVNGKMDLTGAEAVMELIAAQGDLAARTALAAREGLLYRRLEGVKDRLLGLAAGYAAYVDYPDEDIPELKPEAMAADLRKAEQELTTLLETFDAGRMLREGVDTAIVGSPNVGKSTLMNLLAGCERSIVTSLPGTTRDVVEETVRLGDVVLRLSDTAGIRETEDLVEGIGVRRSRDRLASAALVLAVFDGSRPMTEDDREVARCAAAGPAVAVVNKADLPAAAELEEIRRLFPETVVISAEKGEGLEELSTAVARVTGVAGLNAAEPLLATERQRDCAARALDCVLEALGALDAGMALDAAAVSVDGAITAILELTGERTTDAVVDQVFARFCVGK